MVRVAAVQLLVDIDDPDGTRDRLVTAVAEAARRDAAVIVLPELALCGSAFADAAEARSRAEAADGPTVALFAELSARYECVLVGGFAEESGQERPYNSAAVLDGGRLLAVYRKTHLWDLEKVLFTPGDQPPPVVTTGVGELAAMICYDLEFPEMVRSVAFRGAQLVAAPANWPDLGYPRDQHPMEISKALAGAGYNRVVVVVADRVGSERGVDFIGGSVIGGVDGYRIAGPDIGAATVLVAEVDLDAALDKRMGPRNDVFADRRPELY